MNIKKKNNNGFTLVELVVVMCIFSVIFACILDFIKPANKVHNDTQATMDANVISSGLVEYLDDELRYATNVLVLEGYMGVPTVSNAGIVGNTGVSYTNCILVDNVNPRGMLLSSYDENAAPYAGNNRLHATGCVYKISKLDTEGLNFKNAVVAKGVDFYDKFKFNIVASTNVNEATFDKEKNDSNISVNITTYKPVYDNGQLTFKKKFDRGYNNDGESGIVKDRAAVINLTNVNISTQDPFELTAYTSGTLPNPTQVIYAYTQKGIAPTTSIPTGATSSQIKMYDAARQVEVYNENGEASDVFPRYTYIFYEKSGSASDIQCDVKMVYANDHPITSLQGQQIGDTKKQDKGTIFKSFESVPKISGYLDPYWIGPDGKTVDTTAGYRIEKNTTFTCVYAAEATTPQHTVTWQNVDGSVYTTSKVFEGRKPDAMGRPDCKSGATAEENADYWNKHTLVGWYLKGTTTPATDVTILTEGVVFVPKVEDKCHVEFPSVSYDYYIEKGSVATLPSDTPTAPEGKVFDYWVFDGTDEKFDSKPITADTKFAPKFKDKPAGLGGWTFSYTIEDCGTQNSVWDNFNSTNRDCVKYRINLKFNSETAGKVLKGFKVNLKLNKAARLCAYYNGKVTGNGTSTIGIEPTMWGNINDGGTHNLNSDPLYLSDPSVKIESIELVMVSV